jgi:hypothetical protein
MNEQFNLARTKIQHNIALAYDIFLSIPRTIFVKNLSAEERNEVNASGEYTIIDNLAIENIPGINISYVVYFTDKPSLYTIIINNNYLLAGDQGISLTANCCTAFSAKLKIMSKVVNKFQTKREELGETDPMLVSFDVTLAQRPYYRLIDLAPPTDYYACLAALAELPLPNFMAKLQAGDTFEKPEGYSASTRLWTYPYEPANNFITAEPFVESHNLIEGPESYIYTTKSHSVKSAWKHIIQTAPKAPLLCFRGDGGFIARQTVNELYRQQYLDSERPGMKKTSKPSNIFPFSLDTIHH